MLNTIEECNEALAKIDSEWERLQLERRHIMNVHDFLYRKEGKEPPARRRGTEKRRSPVSVKILEFVKMHPGLNGREIKEGIDITLAQRQVTSALNNLRVTEEIENRGAPAGLGGAWYIREKD